MILFNWLMAKGISVLKDGEVCSCLGGVDPFAFLLDEVDEAVEGLIGGYVFDCKVDFTLGVSG